MEGARASSQSFVPVAAEAPREGDGRAIVARRRWALSAVVVILAFAAAFAVGAATKTRTARQGAPQLAPATSARGAPSVGITAMHAAAVPHLTPAPVKSTQSSSRPSAGTQSQTTQSQTTQSQTTQSQTTQSQTTQGPGTGNPGSNPGGGSNPNGNSGE